MTTNKIAAVAEEIVIRRHGLALEVEIDGRPLPALVLSKIIVEDSADSNVPAVTLTIYAARVRFDASIEELEDDDGETQSQATSQTPEPKLRVPRAA